MSPARVAITGMGVVSAIGNDVASFTASLRACRSGIGVCAGPNERWDDADGNRAELLAAAVRDLHVNGELRNVAEASLDPYSRLALVAAAQAIADAGEESIRTRRQRTAVILGTASGGDISRDEACHRIFGRRSRPHPLTVVRVMVNGAVSAVTIAHGFQGPAFTVSSACASAAHAIGQAVRMLQCGMADVAVTGGAEALPSYSQYQAWRQMSVLSRDGCRPFAADRNGFVLGEGAGIVVLERLDDAVARGAKVYGEIAGFGTSADANAWVNPDHSGMLRCMANALDDAGLAPGELAYINAHATGTERGDAAEANAIAELFGGKPDVPVSSTKALHGHALGASGALELIATTVAMSEEWIPPMPAAVSDPGIQLNLVRGDAQPMRGEFAMSNSFGFGGLNASLILRRHS
jgi:nodulation protein E